jgi:two-component system, LytTR family, response regulator
MIKAIIIDDEPLAAMIVREYLADYPQVEVVQECQDGFEGIKAIQQHRPDLVFLDIQMPKINGFEMLELVDDPPGIIFTTAYDEYAIKAFESHAIDYLLKPFDKERFGKAMHKWMTMSRGSGGVSGAAGGNGGSGGTTGPNPVGIGGGAGGAGIDTNTAGTGGASGSFGGTNTGGIGGGVGALLETAAASPAQQQRVVVKLAGRIKIIPVEDIEFLEASDDYVKIHTREGAFLKNKTMNYFEQALDPSRFVRTHRSYILNVQQVTRIDPYEKDSHLCILQSGARVPVSKAGYTKLRAVLGL